MKNKILLFFVFINLAVGIWNSLNIFHETRLIEILFTLGTTMFSFSMTVIGFGIVIITNNFKMDKWFVDIAVTDGVAMFGIIVAIWLWFTGATNKDALINQVKVIPPHSIIFSGCAVVLVILAVWYTLIQLNLRNKALNTQNMPSVSEETTK